MRYSAVGFVPNKQAPYSFENTELVYFKFDISTRDFRGLLKLPRLSKML